MSVLPPKLSGWNSEKHRPQQQAAEGNAHLFHNVPARREDYSAVTKSKVFPLSFCGHRWIENLLVVERALAVWPSLLQYMDAVRTKKLPNPGTASFDTIAAALKDPLVLAKLHFYMAVARTFNPFLKKYQTDEPVMPFLCQDLAELIMVMIYRGSTAHYHYNTRVTTD